MRSDGLRRAVLIFLVAVLPCGCGSYIVAAFHFGQELDCWAARTFHFSLEGYGEFQFPPSAQRCKGLYVE
jgi:hypothetical protein